MSTDGIVVQKATKDKSLWPIQFYINEVKLDHRFKREYMFCAAFAFGKMPDMPTLMRPFIDEINSINQRGGLSVEFGNDTKRLLVVPALFTADSVAKCCVIGKTQFNSYFGCPYCLHPGTKLPDSVQLKYCFRDNTEDRTSQQAKVHMLEAYNTGKNVQGYKKVSPMQALEIVDYDVVWQFVIDKMHSIDLGVVKKMFNQFF